MTPAVEKLVKSAREFLAVLEKIEPLVNGALTIEHIHGRPYTGPNYAKEKPVLYAAISAVEAEEREGKDA